MSWVKWNVLRENWSPNRNKVDYCSKSTGQRMVRYKSSNPMVDKRIVEIRGGQILYKDKPGARNLRAP